MAKKEISDFLKYAYQSGRVRDASEAFLEFPPEEEYHEGKIENIFKESMQEYENYSVGDIVFVKEYNYPNGQKGKNHLFVIIEQNNLAVPIENFGMLISSKIEKVKYPENKLLKADDQNNLDRDRIVKTDVMYLLRNKDILFKIGIVDKDKVEEYKKCFIENK